MAKWYENVWDFVTGQTGKTYANLAKTGVAALSTYAAWKDQQKKNEMQQAAYDDWMGQAEEAGHQAQAAVDINLTPMTVSGVPTTKADVTDFTAVAARGGLMSIPTKQRKRYARGPQEFEVQEMDEEVFSPGDFKMETGVDVLGEQVFYDTGKGDRANAMQIWSQMQDPDKAIFDFDFEIFFMDGGWSDQIKSEVEVGTETQMASAPDPTDEMNNFSINTFGKPLHELTPDQLQELYDLANEQAAAPAAEGIMQAAKGGRIGYQEGTHVADLDAVKDGYSELMFGKPVHELTPDELIELEIMLKDKLGGPFGKKGNAPEGVMAAAHGGRIGYQEGIGPNQGSPTIMAEAITDSEVEDAYGQSVEHGPLLLEIKQIAEQSVSPQDFPATDSDYSALEILSNKHKVDLEVVIQMAKATHFPTPEQSKGEEYAQYMARGGRPGYGGGSRNPIYQDVSRWLYAKDIQDLTDDEYAGLLKFTRENDAKGGRVGRVKRDNGGIMNLGGLEKDYRTTGGFVPIGAYEKKDDVPARLSKNEFVMTADAVRAAGGGSINRGAQRMYDTMKHLEASPQSKRMTA